MKRKGDGVDEEPVFIGEARWKSGRKRAVWVQILWAVGSDAAAIHEELARHFGASRPVRVVRYVRQLPAVIKS